MMNKTGPNEDCINCCLCYKCKNCNTCTTCENCQKCSRSEECLDCVDCHCCTRSYYCSACGACVDCYCCKNCSFCTNNNASVDCHYCRKNCNCCSNCETCEDCFECTNCKNCLNCKKCINCTNCKNCTNCENLANAHDIYNVHKSSSSSPSIQENTNIMTPICDSSQNSQNSQNLQNLQNSQNSQKPEKPVDTLYENPQFELEAYGRPSSDVEAFILDVLNMMHVRLNKQSTENPFIITDPIEKEINETMQFFAELLHKIYKSDTEEKMMEEHLIIYLIKEILTNTDGWKFNPNIIIPLSVTAEDALTLFEIINSDISNDVAVLSFIPQPDDTIGISRRNSIIEKYKAQYVRPDLFVLWYDKKHRNLVKFDFAHMTQEVVAMLGHN